MNDLPEELLLWALTGYSPEALVKHQTKFRRTDGPESAAFTVDHAHLPVSPSLFRVLRATCRRFRTALRLYFIRQAPSMWSEPMEEMEPLTISEVKWGAALEIFRFRPQCSIWANQIHRLARDRCEAFGKPWSAFDLHLESENNFCVVRLADPL